MEGHRGCSPALVKVVLELGADVRQKPRFQKKFTVLYGATALYNVNTPKIVEALCLSGADLSEFWKENIFPPIRDGEVMSSYYDSLKIALKYSVDLYGSIFDIPLNIFIRNGLGTEINPINLINLQSLNCL